jgi:hypothetical protein
MLTCLLKPQQTKSALVSFLVLLLLLRPHYCETQQGELGLSTQI